MDGKPPIGSREVARAAIELSMAGSREEEQRLRKMLMLDGISAAAADFGGDFLPGIMRIVERAVKDRADGHEDDVSAVVLLIE